MARGVIVKVPKGSPAPAGFKLAYSLRYIDVYYKELAPAAPADREMDDLMAAFGQMGVQAKADVVDDLEAAMARLGVGGRRSRRQTRRRTIRRKKTHRRH